MKKKLVTLMLVTVMASMSFAACTSSKDESKDSGTKLEQAKEDDKQNQSEAESSEAQSETVDDSASSSEMSLADWVKGSDMQSILDASNKALNGVATMTAEAEGEDVLIFKYTYKEQYDLSDKAVKKALDEYFDKEMKTKASSFNTMLKGAELATGKDLKKLVIEYDNADGSVIFSKDITGE